MKKLRTRHFHMALYTVMGLCTLFLGILFLFGKKLTQLNFNGMTDAILSVFVMATASFVIFCFTPYFRGDRRWYSISAMLMAAFCFGAGMLWQFSGTVVLP